MAGDWIKMRTSLLKAPQVIRLAGDLNRSKCEVLGALFTIWTIADESSLEGNIKLGAKHLDAEIGLPGFAEALAGVGWLEVLDANNIRLTNYGEHNGKTGKRRAEDYKRAKEQRDKEKALKKAKALQTTSGQNADKNPTDCGQGEDKLPTDCGRNTDGFGLEKEKEKEVEVEVEVEVEKYPLGEKISVDGSFAEQAADLTRHWIHYRKGLAGAREQPGKLLEDFAEALRTGMDFEKALADMRSKSRRRNEFLWQFLDRNHPRIKYTGAGTSMEATLERMASDPEKAKLLEVAFNGN